MQSDRSDSTKQNAGDALETVPTRSPQVDSLALGNDEGSPAARSQSTDLDSQIQLVRQIALTCLKAGRKKADFLVEDAGPIGFRDWAEQQFRKLTADQTAAAVGSDIQQAIAAERERCAKIARNGAAFFRDKPMKFVTPEKYAADLADDIADAIESGAQP